MVFFNEFFISFTNRVNLRRSSQQKFAFQTQWDFFPMVVQKLWKWKMNTLREFESEIPRLRKNEIGENAEEP